jgi:hypothetical protein
MPPEGAIREIEHDELAGFLRNRISGYLLSARLRGPQPTQVDDLSFDEFQLLNECPSFH